MYVFLEPTLPKNGLPMRFLGCSAGSVGFFPYTLYKIEKHNIFKNKILYIFMITIYV